MSGMDRKPKFFCESCGEEVRQNAKLCPHCGRFFASVKCPSCGYSGDARVFKEGCPVCGYAFRPGGPSPEPGDGSSGKRGADPLPWWMYAASIGLLVLLVIVILLRK